MRLGAALRRAWVGYQRRLDQEIATAGFADRGFPDGRVLRMCSGQPGDHRLAGRTRAGDHPARREQDRRRSPGSPVRDAESFGD